LSPSPTRLQGFGQSPCPLPPTLSQAIFENFLALIPGVWGGAPNIGNVIYPNCPLEQSQFKWPEVVLKKRGVKLFFSIIVRQKNIYIVILYIIIYEKRHILRFCNK
jgi:hypothetical protein